MDISELLTQDRIIAPLKAKSKKQVLQEVSARAADITQLSQRDIFDALLQRERLASTGVGRGIAIPHGKIAGLDKIVGLFARLEKPVDFDAFDNEPVDLLFVLLAPETAGADHLKALAKVSRLLRDQHAVEQLRGSKDRAALYAILTAPPSQAASSNAA